MSMSSGSKSNKTVAAEKPTAEKEKARGSRLEGLKKALEERNISFSVFANGDENSRKRSLKEAYSELKTKFEWKYDQPIKEEEEAEEEQE